MKIAVCLYGQPRNFEIGHKYLSNSLKDYEVDYFIHSWFDKSEVGKQLIKYSDKKGEVLDTIKEDTEDRILHLYKPKEYVIEKQRVFEKIPELELNHGNPPDATIPTDVFQSMMYSRRRAINLMDGDYDICIATRTDVATRSDFVKEIEDTDSIYTGFCQGDIWNNGALTCGIIASSTENIKYYGKIYDEFMNLYNDGASYCAHRMAYEHMKKLNKPFKFFLRNNWFWVRNGGALIPAYF